MQNHTQARGMPKYLAIAQDIIGLIVRGELAPGAQIPSENEIMATHGVSNTTARRALQELDRRRWVTRIKGRGTFVRQQPVERTVDRILSFTRNMIEVGRTPSTRLLGVRVSRANKSLTVHGREYRLPGPLYEVRRLRLADGVPMMLETRFVSMQLCAGLDSNNLEGSLYAVYEKEYGIHLARVDQIVRATLLEGDEMAMLGVKEPVPAFRVEGVTFVGREVILEMENSLYRGDTYQFHITATQY